MAFVYNENPRSKILVRDHALVRLGNEDNEVYSVRIWSNQEIFISFQVNIHGILFSGFENK